MGEVKEVGMAFTDLVLFGKEAVVKCVWQFGQMVNLSHQQKHMGAKTLLSILLLHISGLECQTNEHQKTDGMDLKWHKKSQMTGAAA